jgi:hypothetical protein
VEIAAKAQFFWSNIFQRKKICDKKIYNKSQQKLKLRVSLSQIK